MRRLLLRDSYRLTNKLNVKTKGESGQSRIVLAEHITTYAINSGYIPAVDTLLQARISDSATDRIAQVSNR
jgi:hypothetical protein